MEALCLQVDKKYPRDLLQRFIPTTSSDTKSQNAEAEEEDHDDSEEIELNLGLSLGGRFGVDKHAGSKLVRSSSIVGTMPLLRENPSTTSPPTASYPSTLMRTSSLPTETEEEWRKRKELQTLRRMEAKRRRSEKQRNSKTEREEGGGHEADGPKGSGRACGLPTWASASASASSPARQVALSDVLAARGKAHGHGLGLLGGSESESKPSQGSSSCGEARSPASNQQLPPERNNLEAAGGSSGTKTNEKMTKTAIEADNIPTRRPQNRGREIGSNSMEDMPCVFTQGDGPNGKRIEGILYRYGKGQEVRIMCVCHGNFLSPAEFVKHAGGGDVVNPLRHIVVNPNSTNYL
ncbi:ninja-family protein AFP3 [Senna tora]|uniref:Ninja-family protein n=1 Tax=Senna tora TaxID=362788 RepID=A0A834SSC9_9FABA|nr:ninja-family protein AFP3 [Senna tora]